MPGPSYRALRILLVILCFDATAKGLLMISTGKRFMTQLFPYPPESEITTLLLLMRKEWGALDLAVGLMLYFAIRDPVRNVAIINSIAVALVLGAFTSLAFFYALEATRLYPAYSIWGHSLFRLLMAALLYYLRPRKGILAGA